MDEGDQPKPASGGMSRFLMFFMLILTVFILFDPTLRTSLGTAMGFLLFPVIGFGGAYPVLTLLIAGIITSTISIGVRHFFIDWVAMAKSQKIMSAFNKERRDAMMKRNMAKLEKLNQISPEIMQESMSQSMNQLKPMAFTMVIIIVVFAWLFTFVSDKVVDTTVSVPWAFNTNLLGLTVLPHWVLIYALVSIPFGQVLQRVLKYFSFKKKLREMGVLE